MRHVGPMNALPATLLSLSGLALAGAAAAAGSDVAIAAIDTLAAFCRDFPVLETAAPLLAMTAMPAAASSTSTDEINRQLRESNERLKQEVAAHKTTLSELQSVRRDLERRVVERTKELRLVKAQYETALRGASVTVFTQDRELRYTAISNGFL